MPFHRAAAVVASSPSTSNQHLLLLLRLNDRPTDRPHTTQDDVDDRRRRTTRLMRPGTIRPTSPRMNWLKRVQRQAAAAAITEQWTLTMRETRCTSAFCGRGRVPGAGGGDDAKQVHHMQRANFISLSSEGSNEWRNRSCKRSAAVLRRNSSMASGRRPVFSSNIRR